MTDESVQQPNTNDTAPKYRNALHPDEVIVADRMRQELGDLTSLMASIREFDLIQPIVLTRDLHLVAGGRRLAAMKALDFKCLMHGLHFVWRDELDPLRLKAIELEENLKRKDLTWSEIVLGKQQLLEIKQQEHGLATMGRPSASASGEARGFGVRSLAAMLGESAATTSEDLELASYVKKHPVLAQMPTRADARRKLGVAMTTAAMQAVAALKPRQTVIDASGQTVTAPATSAWRLYHGPFQKNIAQVADASCDLVLTDLPYNIGLGQSTAAHSAGLGSFTDSDIDMVSLCRDVAVESYRVLRPNRFAVFFYGMGYHHDFVSALTDAGFSVDPYPFIWLRDRTAPPDGFARYSKSYDPALIASKGTPRFIRPNLANTLAVPSVRGPERLHAAQKPLLLMQKFIEDMTTPGCVVVDMFAGAGTTGEAALRLKRQCVLFELEEPNCVLIESRLGAI